MLAVHRVEQVRLSHQLCQRRRGDEPQLYFLHHRLYFIYFKQLCAICCSVWLSIGTERLRVSGEGMHGLAEEQSDVRKMIEKQNACDTLVTVDE